MTSPRQKIRVDQVVVPDGTPNGAAAVVEDGELTFGTTTGTSASALVPLTTVVAGEPVLVWEADNSLALTEVPR